MVAVTVTTGGLKVRDVKATGEGSKIAKARRRLMDLAGFDSRVSFLLPTTCLESGANI
jgi:hypothetical protein